MNKQPDRNGSRIEKAAGSKRQPDPSKEGKGTPRKKIFPGRRWEETNSPGEGVSCPTLYLTMLPAGLAMNMGFRPASYRNSLSAVPEDACPFSVAYVAEICNLGAA